MRFELTRECSRTSHSLRLSVYLFFLKKNNFEIFQKTIFRHDLIMVWSTRIELARECSHSLLKAARLPVPPRSRDGGSCRARTCDKSVMGRWLWPAELRIRYGGDSGDRTRDLIDANDALSRLSYVPIKYRQKWWSRRESNPHGISHQFLKLACLPFHHSTVVKRIFSLISYNS